MFDVANEQLKVLHPQSWLPRNRTIHLCHGIRTGVTVNGRRERGRERETGRERRVHVYSIKMMSTTLTQCSWLYSAVFHQPGHPPSLPGSDHQMS